MKAAAPTAAAKPMKAAPAYPRTITFSSAKRGAKRGGRKRG